MPCSAMTASIFAGSRRHNSTEAPSRSVEATTWSTTSCSVMVTAGIRPSALGPDHQHRALGVSENRVAMWPDETSDLICVAAADHGELYPSIAHSIKEIGDAGSWSGGMDMHAGGAPNPELYPPVHFVMGHLTEVFSPHSKSKDRCMTQLALFHRLLDNVIIAG